jgi:hypothetical protein
MSLAPIFTFIVFNTLLAAPVLAEETTPPSESRITTFRLSPEQETVLEYERNYLPEASTWTDETLLWIHPTKTGFENSGLPARIRVTDARQGTAGSGKTTSLIVGIERRNVDRSLCELSVQGEGEPFILTGEQNCDYAQALLFYRQRAQLEYTVDIWECVSEYPRYVHGISVVSARKNAGKKGAKKGR